MRLRLQDAVPLAALLGLAAELQAGIYPAPVCARALHTLLRLSLLAHTQSVLSGLRRHPPAAGLGAAAMPHCRSPAAQFWPAPHPPSLHLVRTRQREQPRPPRRREACKYHLTSEPVPIAGGCINGAESNWDMTEEEAGLSYAEEPLPRKCSSYIDAQSWRLSPLYDTWAEGRESHVRPSASCSCLLLCL